MAQDPLDELGPIDYVVLEWPAGSAPSGEAAPMIIDLVDRGIIRVLDVLFVKQNDDGTVSGFEAGDLDGDTIGDFKVFEGASSGLLSDDDVASVGETLTPGSAGVMIVYENRWAAPFAAAVRRNGGVLVANHRITAQELMDAIDTADAVS